jgi:hypothetical protein
MVSRARALAFALAILAADRGFACTLIVDAEHPRLTPEQLVSQADAIALVEAVGLSQRSGLFEFRVVETLRGTVAPSIDIAGTLTEHDDYNEGTVPYPLVRPSGLSGACYAYEYRSGAAYLFLLKRNAQGELTPYWTGLQPTNEQVSGSSDPWVVWVRDHLPIARRAKGPPDSEGPVELARTRNTLCFLTFTVIIRGYPDNVKFGCWSRQLDVLPALSDRNAGRQWTLLGLRQAAARARAYCDWDPDASAVARHRGIGRHFNVTSCGFPGRLPAEPA